MKRETFLQTLTAGHHEILLLCREIQEEARKIRSDGAMGAWEALSTEVHRTLREYVLPHMKAEDQLVASFSYLIGRAHPYLERLRKDHQRLQDLLAQDSLDALLLFAREMEDHVDFEESKLYTLLQESLSDADKGKAAALVERYLSGDTTPPAPKPVGGGRAS